MTIATVLVILNVINGLLSVAKGLPEVQKQVQFLLETVSPHVNAAGKDAQAAFIAAQQRLQDSLTTRINPLTGEPVPE
jgi:hypothetical protein